jgi:hypothetical protein
MAISSECKYKEDKVFVCQNRFTYMVPALEKLPGMSSWDDLCRMRFWEFVTLLNF